ncbi:MAG TPA: hypothetical protein VIV60_17110 [Polyangiaceae bacterium]
MTLNEQFAVTLLMAVGLTSIGCSDGDVGIGSDNPAETKTGLAAYAGNWDGYVEAFKFENGDSDRVRLVLDDRGQGSIRFGDRELLAKPTDPDAVYYPPQEEMLNKLSATAALVFEGFEYPLRESKIEGTRIRTGASSFEIKRDFCAIHIAYPYRDSAGQQFSSDWVVGYSVVPVTFVGVDNASDTCSIVLFEPPPTTVEQLTTTPIYRFPCEEIGNFSEHDIAAYNLAHPDHLLTTPSRLPAECEGDGNGKFRLTAGAADARDVQIDAALDSSGNSLNGSLALSAGGIGLVRNLRLTRVQ